MPAGSVFTPNACAMSTTFVPPAPATLCHKSAYAVLMDTAIAICGVYGPFSAAESLCTRYQPVWPAGMAVAEYIPGSLSRGISRLS